MEDDEHFEPEETRESDVSEHRTRRSESAELPVAVDEYSILKLLGRGGFGIVYLAFDNTLHREVALKIPHAQLVNKRKTADLYLSEARAIASLDHPNIIPVFRAASTDEIPCYIVTKLIRGHHLGRWFKKAKPNLQTLATLLADVADALHYAHENGIVHRDIKPGNILVEDGGHPYVADFGLALRDADIKSSTAYVGTPAYMSPEQARGEGHRVDGRSDVFSLGIVLYELLTGKRPFRGSSNSELYDQILYCDPDHPKELNSAIPMELSRVCLKALSKAASDRYEGADVMADELRGVSDRSDPSVDFSVGTPGSGSSSLMPMTVAVTTDVADDSSVPQSNPVVPKGLRPFGIHDAEFFPRLLPGPHDRLGIPEAIRFWVSTLSSRGAEKAITVGLIYGPSGCGKSSLVRAGIIPRMPPDIDTYYVQATATDTESDLISQISARSVLTGEDPLSTGDIVETFTRLRRSRNQRTVIFIDQFEQWLFANPDCVRAALTDALRQCDGEYLQCVLLVRDDFWMGVTRLMQTLDLPIAEDVNVTAVDLFDARHARQVLALFGAAHGRLPHASSEFTPAQKRFLDAAVDYLANDGRVICVQLALLTEMLKGRPWDDTAAAFHDGGVDLGMRFFDETFDSDSAPRRIRMHAEGTRRVLKALLPELGSPIKGALRTEQELFDASGYGDREHFRQLVTMLDRELHLITPTDQAEDKSSIDSALSSDGSAGYQLTHDFLITPIRQWIEYHSQATPQGQARLRLDQFAELYRLHPRRQSLPTMGEYFWIRKHLGTDRIGEAQREMMSAAQKQHGRTLRNAALVTAACLLAVFLSVFAFNQYRQRLRQDAAFDAFLVAGMGDAAQRANKLRDVEVATQAAVEVLSNDSAPEQRRVRAAMLLVNDDPQADELLSQYMLSGDANEVVQIATTLEGPLDWVSEDAMQAWAASSSDAQTRLRAACVLAQDPDAAKTLCEQPHLAELCDLLLLENPVRIPTWHAAFQPIAGSLLKELVPRFQADDRKPGNLNAVNLIVDYADDDTKLAKLIPYAQANELFVLADAVGVESVDLVRGVWREELNAPDSGQDPSRPWHSAWWAAAGNDTAIEPNTSELPADLIKTLEKAETAVDSITMVSHRVSLDDLESLAESLAEHGFRVSSCIPYLDGQSIYAEVLWNRDSAVSRVRWGLAPEELRRENASQLGDGFIPDDIVAYQTDSGHRYACVWIQPPHPSLKDADMYVEVHEDRHEVDGWRPFLERGLWLNRSNLQVLDSDGVAYLTSIRWDPKSGSLGFKDEWDLTGETAEAMIANCRHAALLQRRQRKGSEEDDAPFATLWFENVPVETRSVKYQPRREHLRTAQLLIQEGYRAVSIDNGSIGKDGTPLFASVWWKWTPDAPTRIRRARRRANLAFALLRLGDDFAVKQSIAVQDDPELRGAVIAGFSQLNLPCTWLMARLLGEDAFGPADSGDGDFRTVLRRSCAMALSLCQQNNVPLSLRDQLARQLPEAYRAATDPGMRSSLEAVATSWSVPLEAVPDATVDEIRSAVGHRLPIIRPSNPVWIGSPVGEPGRDEFKEPMTPVIIDRSYAISTKAVTIEEFRRFNPNAGYPESYADDERCPMININWFDAVKYCRWLSDLEGLPESEMCYPPLDEIDAGLEDAEYDRELSVLNVPDDFLDRIGYRLPTEAEWEYACRGGAASGRWFGFDPERLDEHAWTTRNSGYRLHPVGGLLPNDYGLFDMLGNAMDLCHSSFEEYDRYLTHPGSDNHGNLTGFTRGTSICNRGGAMLYQPLDARASQREFHSTDSPKVYLTFRIVRTVRE